jgi:hypothetical protein
MIPVVLAAYFLQSLFCAPGNVRPVPLLSYGELNKRAHVVLIVRPEETRDAVDNDPIIEIGRDHSMQYLTACVTPMKVLAVLKGTYEGKEFVLSHYRMDWAKAAKNGIQGIGNGPSLVVFAKKRTDGPDFDDTPVNRDYILFLTKREDGQYDFVTGQFDPSFSVFRLNPASLDRGEQ